MATDPGPSHQKQAVALVQRGATRPSSSGTPMVIGRPLPELRARGVPSAGRTLSRFRTTSEERRASLPPLNRASQRNEVLQQLQHPRPPRDVATAPGNATANAFGTGELGPRGAPDPKRPPVASRLLQANGEGANRRRFDSDDPSSARALQGNREVLRCRPTMSALLRSPSPSWPAA